MVQVEVIPALSDNYIFSLEYPHSNFCVLVDPGEQSSVENYLNARKKVPKEVILTHHHHDHVGAVAYLKKKYQCQVYGPSRSLMDFVDHPCGQGDLLQLDPCVFQVHECPGHTLDHLFYYEENNKILFCGDLLFSLGCGRVFEGSMEQMFCSLQKLLILDDETTIYCAHEYTMSNLKFTLSLGKDRQALEEFSQNLSRRLELEGRSVPTLLGLEKKLNPFLKAKSAGDFQALRKAKDSF